MEYAIGKARALNDRLEITGQETLGLAQARDPHRLKILFEKRASGIRMLRPEP
jgi:hypothetical protein